MNKVFLIGNATKDAEVIQTPNGVSVCKFGLAVSRRFNQDETDFFNIVAWRGLADNCGKFIKKGNKTAVIGSIQMRTYELADGSKKTITEIVADEVQFLTPKGDNQDATPKLTPVTDDETLPF